MTITAVLFGSTGLSGQSLLSSLLELDMFQTVYTVSRRAPKIESPRLSMQIEVDTSKWASSLSSLIPAPLVAISAVGTTRVQAGSIVNQWKIDHDVNIELAKAAYAAGVNTYIFVSSTGTQGWLSRNVPYWKMKQGVESAIKNIGFGQVIIMRPGLILGKRPVNRMGELFLNKAVRNLGKIKQEWRNRLGQDADMIGRAATYAIILALEGKAPSKYWVLEQTDIVRLGSMSS
ncbi:hypothetical protein DL764_008617 [Monosporascus ibericus]|uniref:NAD-dependent epimerase/dehydratase domain-containing protein n=1 Tax=Monosporascus ibericus TaxID=155417 RepID=A0A4Q4SZ99_9PEZI|nr:hypothetical protein DL764_008617 [Monosporascus ibericus]